MIPTWVRDPKNGDLYINDLRKFVKGGVTVPAPGVNPLTVAAAAGAGIPTLGTPVIIEGAQDGVREIFSMIGVFDATSNAAATARFSVLITDQAYRRRYMNRDVLVTHIFGTPGNPVFLAKEIWLENQQILLIQFFNNSVAGAAVFRQLYEERSFQAQSLTREDVTKLIQQKRKDALFFNPYWFTSDAPIIVPAAGQATAFFTNTRDYYLMLRYIVASSITTGVAGNLQDIATVMLFDATNSRPLMNQPMPLTMMTGTAAFPYVLPQPWAIEPATVIRADFQNLVTDQPTEIFFTFHGVGCFVADQNPLKDSRVALPAVTPAVYGAP